MSTTIRRYSELLNYTTLEERYEYLRLYARVGDTTFGFERYLNQRFYTSREWRTVRDHVIARDLGGEMGIVDFPISGRIIIHHMNPMAPQDLIEANDLILDPEYLISVSHNTHNAIHYGDKSLLPQPYVPRTPGDTDSWIRIGTSRD